MKTASHVVRHVAQAGKAEAEDVLACIVKHGYLALPLDNGNIGAKFFLSEDRRHVPITCREDIRESFGIVLCHSTDIVPILRMNAERRSGATIIRCDGFVASEDRFLTLTFVDTKPAFDTALALLHEGRHARNMFGASCGESVVEESDDIHEARTWKFELDVIDECGGKTWQRVVEKEAVWIADRMQQRGRKPGDTWFAMSGSYSKELDTVFGKAALLADQQERSTWVSMRALLLLAERHGVDPAVACERIIPHYYAWIKSHTPNE